MGNVHTVVDWVGCVTAVLGRWELTFGRWDLCDVSALGDWYLDAVDLRFCPRLFPHVKLMELA